MHVYAGRFAELYDQFYAQKPYQAEADLLRTLLRDHQGREPIRNLLELACGTGTNAVLMAESGFSVVATDISPDMLACARSKGSAVEFLQQDMVELDLPGCLFDAALCLFDSLGYLVTLSRVERVLQRVRRHLRVDGLFVFDVWHAAAMLRNFEPARVRTLHTTHGTIVRLSETELDVRDSLARVTYSIFDPQADGSYRLYRETHTNRFFTCGELQALADTHGFDVVSLADGFQLDRPVGPETWHVAAVLRAR